MSGRQRRGRGVLSYLRFQEIEGLGMHLGTKGIYCTSGDYNINILVHWSCRRWAVCVHTRVQMHTSGGRRMSTPPPSDTLSQGTSLNLNLAWPPARLPSLSPAALTRQPCLLCGASLVCMLHALTEPSPQPRNCASSMLVTGMRFVHL